MILGIGTDIIEIERIKVAIERTPSFLSKAFTEKERELFKSKGMRVETIAGNFAAKEALSRALGTGFRGYSLQDFEILRDNLGKPIVNISKEARDKIGDRKLNINVSISHNKSNAIAFAIVEE